MVYLSIQLYFMMSFLHVPDLASNLLSLLHLTCVKRYVINIGSDHLCFYYSNQLHFTASVTPNNVGYLDGQVIVPKQAESARFAITCPLDLTLWHRRCSHINFDDLKHMHSHNLVSGMVICSTSPPDLKLPLVVPHSSLLSTLTLRVPSLFRLLRDIVIGKPLLMTSQGTWWLLS